MLPVPSELRLRMTSDPAEIADTRREAEAFATAHGFSETAVGEIGLVLNEAIANVIRHAYAGVEGKPIEINLHMTGDRLHVALRDWGNGKLPDVSKEKTELHTPGGIGLPCMKQMTSGLSFEKQADGMLLTMTKQRT